MKLKLSTKVALGFALFFLLSITAMVVPEILEARADQQRVQTRLDLQMLTLAAQAYASEHGGTLPESNHWSDQLTSISGSTHEPAIDSTALATILNRKQCGYAISSEIAGRAIETIATNSILFFPINRRGMNLSCSGRQASDLAWNKSNVLEAINLQGGVEILIRPIRIE